MFARALSTRQSQCALSGRQDRCRRALDWLAVASLALAATSCERGAVPFPTRMKFTTEFTPGLTYTNYRTPAMPLSVHIARLARSQRELQLQIAPAFPAILGMTTLSNALLHLKPAWGQPLVGINGDFFERVAPYAGDPRGLQIIDGELTSGPGGWVSFWTDARGEPHAEAVQSLFKLTWPDGRTLAFGLNEHCRSNSAVLYTGATGVSTHTSNTVELVLAPEGKGPWLPLRIGQTYTARVEQAPKPPNTPIESNRMVLALGPMLATNVPTIDAGAILKFSTATKPDLTGAQMGMGGGPLLVHNGQRQVIREPTLEEAPTPYAKRAPFERHPRTGFGWNRDYFFLVEVDGRQTNSSVGLTLSEFSECLSKLGCTEAMNLDGGGSATFWFNGRTVNSPCDKREREIANALLVVRRDRGFSKVEAGAASPAN